MSKDPYQFRPATEPNTDKKIKKPNEYYDAPTELAGHQLASLGEVSWYIRKVKPDGMGGSCQFCMLNRVGCPPSQCAPGKVFVDDVTFVKLKLARAA